MKKKINEARTAEMENKIQVVKWTGKNSPP